MHQRSRISKILLVTNPSNLRSSRRLSPVHSGSCVHVFRRLLSPAKLACFSRISITSDELSKFSDSKGHSVFSFNPSSRRISYCLIPSQHVAWEQFQAILPPSPPPQKTPLQGLEVHCAKSRLYLQPSRLGWWYTCCPRVNTEGGYVPTQDWHGCRSAAQQETRRRALMCHFVLVERQAIH